MQFVTAVLRHMEIPDAEHAAHVDVDSYEGHGRWLSKRALTTYLAVYRSLTADERAAVEMAL